MRSLSAAIGIVLLVAGSAGCSIGTETYAVARTIEKDQEVGWSDGVYPSYQCSDQYDSLVLTEEEPVGVRRDIEVTIEVASGQVVVHYRTINMTAAGYIIRVTPEVAALADSQQRFAASGTTNETVVWRKPASFESITLCFVR